VNIILKKMGILSRASYRQKSTRLSYMFLNPKETYKFRLAYHATLKEVAKGMQEV